MLFLEDYDDEFDLVFGIGLYWVFGLCVVLDLMVYVSVLDDLVLWLLNDYEVWFVLVNVLWYVVEGVLDLVVSWFFGWLSGIDWMVLGFVDVHVDWVFEVMVRRGFDVWDWLLWCEVCILVDFEWLICSVGGLIYGMSSNGIWVVFLWLVNWLLVFGLFFVGGLLYFGGGILFVGLFVAIVADFVG